MFIIYDIYSLLCFCKYCYFNICGNKTLILKAHIDIYVKSLICLLLKDFYFCWDCIEEGYSSQALEWGR